MKIAITILALALMASAQTSGIWTRSTEVLHGGMITLGACVGNGGLLDLKVKCNFTEIPCVLGSPANQYGKKLRFEGVEFQDGSQVEHWRLITTRDGCEIITALTWESNDFSIYEAELVGSKK